MSSTVKGRLAGVWSVLVAESVARTSKVWGPGVSSLVVCGEPHGANDALSTLHSKVEAGSLEEKEKVGVGSLVGSDGPESIVV